MIRHKTKTVGWGSLGALLEKARQARADTWERVRRVVGDGAAMWAVAKLTLRIEDMEREP